MDWQARAVSVFHCITCRMLISLLMRASTYRQRLHYHKTSLTPSSVAAAKSRPRKLIYPRVKGWNIQWLVWIELSHPRRTCHWRRSAQRRHRAVCRESRLLLLLEHGELATIIGSDWERHSRAWCLLLFLLLELGDALLQLLDRSVLIPFANAISNTATTDGKIPQLNRSYSSLNLSTLALTFLSSLRRQ